ncbi:MAG: YggT family protein [Spirochaetaceae bacterium]|nr:MAG: YggT family protein [Spirochaetaceae bacterium]
MLQSVMRLVSAVISIYMLILLVRIIMTWFQTPSYGRATMYLQRITDPYLDFFRRFRFMQIGYVDFSPVLALVSLSILADIANSLAFVGRVTLGFVLARLVASVWSAASFFFTLFLIVAVVRLLAMMIGVNTAGRFWITLDRILQPMASGLVRRLARGQSSYQHALMLFAAVVLIGLLLGNLIIARLVPLLVELPL